jgi:hypothetical protein
MTTTTVSSGQTVSSATLGAGSTEIVLAGGFSIDPRIRGGNLEVMGGTVVSALLSRGEV